MFDFRKDYRFAWPVTVLVPTLEGQVEKMFKGIFRLVPKDELDKATAADPNNADTIVARMTLIDWNDMVEGTMPETKKLPPYSKEAHEEMLAVPFVRYAIAKAYYEAVSGVLRLKN